MTEAKKQKMPPIYRLLVLAIVFLTNPVVNIFDYFPDFIGYIIIARTLQYYAVRVPYFEEARVAFKRLSYVSLAKIPAYVVMIYARGQNAMDNDIKSLFTFTFTVIEIVLLFDALRNLFSAFAYLGERSDAASLISPFPLNKKGDMKSPDALRNISFVFIFLKGALTAIPETLLLTKSVDTGSYVKVFNVARLYPYVIIIAVITVLIYGAIITGYYKKFIRAILTENKIKEAADSILDDSRRKTLKTSLMIKSMRSSLSLLIIAAALTVDVCFDNLLGINLLPRFIYGIIMTVAVIRIAGFTGGSKRALPFGILYTLTAALAYVVSVQFLSSFGYEALAESAVARQEYLSLVICTSAELLFATLLIIFTSLEITKFAYHHTGLMPSDPRYSRTDATYHKETKRRIVLWSIFGILVFLGKALDTAQRYFSENKLTSTTDEVITTTYSALPWFGTFVLILSVIYIGITIHLVSRLKEDCEIKYS